MGLYDFPYSASPFAPLSGTRTTVPARRREQFVHLLVWMCFPITLGLAITRQSLWIDEGFTVWFAYHGDFQSFLRSMIGTRGEPGDPQFIFYLLHIWGWIKLFGASELSLRAANIPFAVICAYSLHWASRHLFWSNHLWALFCLSPFFWFYLNEARPYAAIMAFSSVACVALLAYLADPFRYGKHAPWYCLIALFLGWGMHILTFFLFPVLLILVAMSVYGNPELRSLFLRHWRRPVLCTLPAFSALAVFFAYVSANGVNKIDGDPGLANLAFILYEFVGLAGLGPPRNEIRQVQDLAVFLPYWPWLVFALIVFLTVMYSVLGGTRSRLARNLAFSVACGIVIALFVSRFEHFKVLGRHMAVLFPPLLMTLLVSPPRPHLSYRSSRLAMASITALAFVWGISDLRLVFLSKYQKDSYREASSLALTKSREEGAVIIWAADPITARYYGITVENWAPSSDFDINLRLERSAPASAVAGSSWDLNKATTQLATSPVSTILVLSRPESFDPQETWRTLIRNQHPSEIARLNSMTVYEWQPQAGTRCSNRTNPVLPPRDLLVDNVLRTHLPHYQTLAAHSAQLAGAP